MTYGQNPVPPGPNYNQGPAAAPAGGLLAPTGPSSSRRTALAGVGLIGAILLIVGSFLAWATVSAEFKEPTLGASIQLEATATGMGSSSNDFSVDFPDGTPQEIVDAAEEGLASEMAEDDGSDTPKSSGIWTIIFGVVIAVGAILLVLRRFPGIGALIALAGGLAALIATAVFLSDPVAAVSKDGEGIDASELPGASISDSAGIGLWLALVGALLGLLAGAAAVALVLRPSQFDNAAPQVAGPGGAPYGQPGYPQQQGFPQQPQGGFPPPAPGQAPPNFPPQQGGQQPPQG